MLNILGIDIGSRFMGVAVLNTSASDFRLNNTIPQLNYASVVDLGGKDICVMEQVHSLPFLIKCLITEQNITQVMIEDQSHTRSKRNQNLATAIFVTCLTLQIPVFMVPPCRRIGFKKNLKGYERKKHIQESCRQFLAKETVIELDKLNEPKPREDIYDAISVALTNPLSCKVKRRMCKPEILNVYQRFFLESITTLGLNTYLVFSSFNVPSTRNFCGLGSLTATFQTS